MSPGSQDLLEVAVAVALLILVLVLVGGQLRLYIKEEASHKA